MNFSPFGYGFCFAKVFNVAIVFLVSALSFIGSPSNVFGSVSGIVVNAINAEISGWSRARPEKIVNVISENRKIPPLFAHGNSSIKIPVGLFICRPTAPMHVNPSGIENGSFPRVLVFPMLREHLSCSFNATATATERVIDVVAKNYFLVSAIAQTEPLGIPFFIKSGEFNDLNSRISFANVTLDGGRNFHLPQIIGLIPQIVNF